MTKSRTLADRMCCCGPGGAYHTPATGMSNFAPVIAAGRACISPLVLLFGLAACTGSPASLALRPDFEVMTPAGIASVSIRESPPGMSDAEFTRFVEAGMEHGARDTGRIEPPLPSQRIVWHVDPSASRGMSRLVVNVFDGANPYAYELETVPNSGPTVEVRSAIESMSHRLMADIAARGEPGGGRGQNGTSREDHFGGKS